MKKWGKGSLVPHDEVMVELLRAHPSAAIGALNETLADGSAAEIAIALRHMANAFGGLPTIARQAGINVTQAYRSLSKKGNPSFKTVNAVVRAAGCEFVIRRRRSRGGKAAGSQAASR